MVARPESFERLTAEARRERGELVRQMAAARRETTEAKRRVGPWLALLAALGAGTAAVFGVTALVRRYRGGKSPLAKARRVFEKTRDRIDANKPRPLPLSRLLLVLRSPTVRRALVQGITGAVARRSAADPETSRSSAPEASASASITRPDPEKAAKNEAAPPEEVGEAKAAETMEELEKAPLRRKLGFATHLLKESFAKFQQDEALTRGAALAYYTMLSLAPLLIIVVAVAGIAFGADEVRTRILGQIGQLVGKEAAATVGTLMQKAARPSSSIPATIIGVVTLLIGAGGVFGYLQDMFNKIWRVEKKKKGGIWNLVRSRFLSLAMVLGTGFLLLVSLVVSAGINAVSERFSTEASLLFQILHQIVSWAVIALMFALIYRYLPDTRPRIAWRDVWIGAGLTSLLFALGQFLIGLYLGRASVASVYGGAGSLVIVLLWTYYSGLILFFGAEMTAVFANRWGSRKDVTVPATSEKRTRP